MSQHEMHSALTQQSTAPGGPVRRTTFQESDIPSTPNPTFAGSRSPLVGDSMSRSNSRRSEASRMTALQRARTVLSLNLKPERPIGQTPGFVQSIKAIILASWLNLLLVCIPVSWVLHFIWDKNTTSTQDTVIFVFSFLSIIPLAKLLAFATDELSLRVGQTLAGLLNATLGNAVELIVSILALVKCELQIVSSSLVGSILSNLLLVLGMCFFAGGLRFSEQGFGISAVQIQSSLLTLSVVAVLIPAAFHFVVGAATNTDSTEGPDLLAVSHGVAIILLVIYISYLIFQLFSHQYLYDETKQDTQRFQSTLYPKSQQKKRKEELEKAAANGSSTALPNGGISNGTAQAHTAEGELSDESHTVPEGGAGNADLEKAAGESKKDEEEEGPEAPQMSLKTAIIFLIIITVLVAVTAEWLVDSIDGLTSSGHISKEFVGLILLPIVGNAAEHVTAVTVSVRDKLDLSLGVAVGSSIQIALFVIPFMVTLGWIIGKPLTLLFDPFESIVLFLSIIVVNYTVQDGKSNWLEGAILMCLYIILAVVFWYYPGSDISQSFGLPGCPATSS